MASGVFELIEMLYSLVSDAWGLPLGAEKCVVERDKVLDLLDEIKAQMPAEISEAKRLVSARADFIAGAKREADAIKAAAEAQAQKLVDEQEILRITKEKCMEMIQTAEQRSAELRKSANEYADDAMRRTEEAINEALSEVKGNRARFREASSRNQG